MESRLVIFFFLGIIAVSLALPAAQDQRKKRDVMDSMKNAWGEVVKTFSDASDAVVHVFKPTEKSTIDKMADSVANAFVPTEKSTLDKMADGIKNLTQ